MTIPGASEQVLDGGLNQVEPSAMTPVYFGLCSSGTPNVLRYYSRDAALKDALGDGPGVEAALFGLKNGGGPVGVVPCDPTIAAANGSPQRVGTSGPAVSYSGNATLDARFRIVIVAPGIRGKARFKYTCDDYAGALDSERTYSEELAVPAGGTFAVPNLGITATFAAATVSTVTQTGTGPAATITGTPADDYDIVIEVTTGGIVGTAAFKWSLDGGLNYTTGVTTATTVTLGSTGLTAGFPAGTYVLATTYAASVVAYVAGEQYYCDVTCAAWNASDLAECMTAVKPETWRFIVPVTSRGTGDATAHALLAVALQSHLNSFAASSIYRRGMIAAEQFGVPASDVVDQNNAATVVAAQASVSAKRVLVAYGAVRRESARPFSGYAFPTTHAVDVVAARAISSLASTDLKRVRSGALDGVVKTFHDEEKNPTGLDTAKLTTLRTHRGRTGVYITQGRLKSDTGSDFKLWPHGILMDIACETAHEAHIEFIGAGFRMTDAGTIDDRDASAWEQGPGGKLFAALLAPRNAEGFSGHVSDIFYEIDRTHVVATDNIVLYTVGIRPLNYPDFVKGQLGFFVQLPNLAA